MSSIASVLARSQAATSQRLFGTNGTADDSFAKVFESMFGAPATKRGKIQEALNNLGRRFPGLSIQSADVAKGVEGARKHFGREDGKTDAVAVSPSVLSGLFGNGDLAKMVEDAISGFLERGAGNDLMNVQGAYVQRTVAITITEVRYTELHRSQETDEVLAADELKTNFSERLSELIKKFFGGFGASGTGESAETEEDAATEAAEEAKKTDQASNFWNGSAAASMWSLELYYSSTLISSMQNTADGGGSSMSALMQSWQFSASYSGKLSGVSSNLIPESILGVTGVSASGGMAFGTIGSRQSSISSALERTLSAVGLEAGGYRVDGEGHYVSMRERRNLLSELMELYQGKLKQSTGAEENAEAEVEELAETVA